MVNNLSGEAVMVALFYLEGFLLMLFGACVLVYAKSWTDRVFFVTIVGIFGIATFLYMTGGSA